MAAVLRENGVLKLVHPGGYVEIHREPITAAEVMKKNPRHCVTRPDVFKFPWIVVRPESMLKLGRVFFIVPNRTIHHLLQTYDQRIHQFSSKCHSPRCRDHRQRLRQTSPLEPWAEETATYQDHHAQYHKQQNPHGCLKFPCNSGTILASKCQSHDQRLERQSKSLSKVNHKHQVRDQHRRQQSAVKRRTKVTPEYQYPDSCLQQQYQFMFSAESTPMQQGCDKQIKKQNSIEASLDELIAKKQEHHRQFKQEPEINSVVEAIPSSPAIEREIPATDDGEFKLKICNQVTTLKSCLRKYKDSRSCNLRVRFALPDEHDREEFEQSVLAP